MIWICIAYKMYKNFTMHIKCIYIEQFFSHTIQRKTQIHSEFDVRREDTYWAALKKSIENAFSNISKEYVCSCYFPRYKIHSSYTSKVGTQF
jgi:hypothetical protein